MATSHISNQHEAAARQVKVAKLVAMARADARTVREVATDPQVRADLVLMTGVREPSDETWREVIRAMTCPCGGPVAVVGLCSDCYRAGVPMPRRSTPGAFREWCERGIVADRVGSVA